jgi:hypothetical protein
LHDNLVDTYHDKSTYRKKTARPRRKKRYMGQGWKRATQEENEPSADQRRPPATAQEDRDRRMLSEVRPKK